jgi:hypothetical protein
MNLERRIRRVEEKLRLAEAGKLVVFKVRYGNEQEDFDRQYSEYIQSGGNPDVMFIRLVEFAFGDSEDG